MWQGKSQRAREQALSKISSKEPKHYSDKCSFQNCSWRQAIIFSFLFIIFISISYFLFISFYIIYIYIYTHIYIYSLNYGGSSCFTTLQTLAQNRQGSLGGYTRQILSQHKDQDLELAIIHFNKGVCLMSAAWWSAGRKNPPHPLYRKLKIKYFSG